MPVDRIGWLLLLCRLGVGKEGEEFRVLQRVKYGIGSIDDEDGPAPPHCPNLLPRVHLTDVDINWHSGCDDRGVWFHLIDKRPHCICDANDRHRACKDVEEIPSSGFVLDIGYLMRIN